MSGENPAQARQRLAATAFMASLIGHKARNRLALVRAGLELLQIGAESALTAEHRNELLLEMDRFLGDFNLGLDMIRCDFGMQEDVTLLEVISEAVETVRPKADQMGIVIADQPEIRLRTDRRLLRMVLLNLLRNSLQAGAREVAIETAALDETVVLTVRDDGPGLPPELLPQLFHDVVRGHSEGTGLGLILCRDSLLTMGGTIRHVPSANGGAAFEVILPKK